MNQDLAKRAQAGAAVSHQTGHRAQSQPQQNGPMRAGVARAHVDPVAAAGAITPRTSAFKSFIGIGLGRTCPMPAACSACCAGSSPAPGSEFRLQAYMSSIPLLERLVAVAGRAG